jgi:hypothetical protein
MKNRNNIAVLFFIFWVIASCAYSIPLTKSDYSAITEGQKSLVLLRVTCEIPGESDVKPFQGFISDDNVNIALGDFETGGALKRMEIQKFLSAETRDQGWVYFILEPGIYYLGFQGQRRTDAFTYAAQWKNVQHYRFDIQPDSPVAYIGTMHLQCRSDWFLFGAKYCCFIDSQVVMNEEALAQKLVSENLKTMGPPKTALMQLHTEKTFIFRSPKPKK